MFFFQRMNNSMSFNRLNNTYKLAQQLALCTMWGVFSSTGQQDDQSTRVFGSVSVVNVCFNGCRGGWSFSNTCCFIQCTTISNKKGFILLFRDKLLHAAEPPGPTERPLASYLAYCTCGGFYRNTQEGGSCCSTHLWAAVNNGKPPCEWTKIWFSQSPCFIWDTRWSAVDKPWPSEREKSLLGGRTHSGAAGGREGDRSGYVREHSFSPEVFHHPHQHQPAGCSQAADTVREGPSTVDCCETRQVSTDLQILIFNSWTQDVWSNKLSMPESPGASLWAVCIFFFNCITIKTNQGQFTCEKKDF